MARKVLSDEQVEIMRDSFCDAAYELYQSEDYEAISMRGMAKRIGCSPMTAYRYFENKEEVFALLRARLFTQLADRMECVATDLPALDYLKAIGDAYMRYAQDNPDAYRLLYMVHLRQAKPHPVTDNAQKRTRKILLRATKGAIDSGDIKGEPVVVAHLLWASIHGLISLELANQLTQGASFDELVPSVLQGVIHQYSE